MHRNSLTLVLSPYSCLCCFTHSSEGTRPAIPRSETHLSRKCLFVVKRDRQFGARAGDPKCRILESRQSMTYLGVVGKSKSLLRLSLAHEIAMNLLLFVLVMFYGNGIAPWWKGKLGRGLVSLNWKFMVKDCLFICFGPSIR